MPSTVIRRFVYDTGKRELWIEFVSGRRYVYEEVPDTVADTLRSAFAKGGLFQQPESATASNAAKRRTTSRPKPNLKPGRRQSRHDPDALQLRSSRTAGSR